MINSNKLIIGSAGFSDIYGIDKKAHPKKEEVKKIFDYAAYSGINKIDTAMDYGLVNKLIAKYNLNRFSTITKFNCDKKNFNDMKKEFNTALSHLKIRKIHGVLFHKSSCLLTENGCSFYNFLQEKKEVGVISNIGVSIYSPNELDNLLDKYHFDIIQAPVNIIDNRIVKYWNKNITNLVNTKLHARSIYLQGILLKNSSDIEKKFSRLRPLLDSLEKKSLELNINRANLLFNYVNSIKIIENIIIGFWSVNELKETLNFSSKSCKNFFLNLNSNFDEGLIDPRRW